MSIKIFFCSNSTKDILYCRDYHFWASPTRRSVTFIGSLQRVFFGAAPLKMRSFKHLVILPQIERKKWSTILYSAEQKTCRARKKLIFYTFNRVFEDDPFLPSTPCIPGGLLLYGARPRSGVKVHRSRLPFRSLLCQRRLLCASLLLLSLVSWQLVWPCGPLSPCCGHSRGLLCH